MSAAGTMLAGLALREARRGIQRLAADKAKSRLECPNWRLEGKFELEPIGKGRFLVRLDPADPLRLRHLPTGRCLCPAYREFETDLASVPAIAKRIGRHFESLHLESDSYVRDAIFHDALYEAGWCWVVQDGQASRATVTRAQSDAILYLCLCCDGATVADGIAYHAGVRLGGASHWRDARRDTAKWPLLFDLPESGVEP